MDDLDIDSLSMVRSSSPPRTSSASRSPTTRSRTSSTVGDAVAYIAKAGVSALMTTTSDVQRVVVTGLGATTPLGGDVAVDLAVAARRPVGRAGPRRGAGYADAAGTHRRHRRGRPERGAAAASRSARSTAPAVRPDRLPRGVGRRRSAGGRPGAARRRRRLRHRRRRDACSTSTTSCKDKGPRRVSPLDRADADAQRPGRCRSASTSAPAPGSTPRSAPARPAPRRSATPSR